MKEWKQKQIETYNTYGKIKDGIDFKNKRKDTNTNTLPQGDGCQKAGIT